MFLFCWGQLQGPGRPAERRGSSAAHLHRARQALRDTVSQILFWFDDLKLKFRPEGWRTWRLTGGGNLGVGELTLAVKCFVEPAGFRLSKFILIILYESEGVVLFVNRLRRY